jgi:hypothetical protein
MFDINLAVNKCDKDDAMWVRKLTFDCKSNWE